MFSSTACLLLPVVAPALLLGLCRGSLHPDLPFCSMHLGTPLGGALGILPCPSQPKALTVLGAAQTLCCLPLLKGLFSYSVRANLTLRTQGCNSPCSPGAANLPREPTAWCQPKSRCQGKKGCFSTKVGAGLLLLTGRPDGM